MCRACAPYAPGDPHIADHVMQRFQRSYLNPNLGAPGALVCSADPDFAAAAVPPTLGVVQAHAVGRRV